MEMSSVSGQKGAYDSLFWSVLPGPSLDVMCCAGRLQRNHELLFPYKEDTHYLHDEACVKWGCEC